MKNLFLGFIVIFCSLISLDKAFSQTPTNTEQKTDEIERPVDVTATTTHSVKVKKKPFKLPAYIAPANTTIDANCADRLGKGDSGYTACQAGKGTR